MSEASDPSIHGAAEGGTSTQPGSSVISVEPTRTSPPPTECFLCCEGPSKGVLVSNVCLCRDMAMHLSCQRRMLEMSYARGGHLLRCGVCHATYSNAAARPVWRLSLTGALWCTCPAGVFVMLWSASTVLDRGSAAAPPLSYASGSWWTYQLHYMTWWRLIGLAYLAIGAFMAVFACAWLAVDVFARPATRMLGFIWEPLCVRRRIVICWRPEASSGASSVAAEGGPLFEWRRLGAMLLPCAEALSPRGLHVEDRERDVTVLL